VKLLLVFLVLLVIAGIYLLKISGSKRINPAAGMVIIVKDQEPWIEGFIRKLFRSMKSTPRTVLIVDDCSCDGTLKVLGCLQRHYLFGLLSVKDGDDVWQVVETLGKKSRFLDVILFDARGLSGKDLLLAPLFSHLSRSGAGKIKNVSK